ncbi:Uncharacterized protein QTN25_000475 [Entamoeba marina]
MEPKTPMEIPQTKKRKEVPESFMQALYIAILNKIYDIRIEAPQDRSLTFPFLNIVSITTECDEINVVEYVERRIQELYNNDIQKGITKHTADRRMTRNRVKESLKLLCDAIEMHDSMNATHENRRRTKLFPDWSIDVVVEKGKEINQFITGLFVGNDDVTLFKNDRDLEQLLCVR